MKLAVLFPGIGYTCDKPLLYYSGKLAAGMGYEVKPVPYGGFPKQAKGNREKMEEAFRTALGQAGQILKDVKWSSYEEIVFFSKSIGTVAGAVFARDLGMPVRHILYTPLAETFSVPLPDAIAFHGTSDPWAGNDEIEQACAAQKIPLFLTSGANHSLETGDPFRDLETLQNTMKTVDSWLKRGAN